LLSGITRRSSANNNDPMLELTSLGGSDSTELKLASMAQKVLFSIKSRVASSLGNIPIKVSNNIFDKLVQPVLTYNAELFFMDSYLTYYRAKRRAEISNKEIDNFTFIDKNISFEVNE
jgi:hypothetical protein